jgi:fructose-1,6-bisphosphatase I
LPNTFLVFCQPLFDSATTVLVLTLGSGVDGFTLDPDTSRFLHTHQDLRIPAAGPIYSFNEANFHDFDDPVQRYLNALKEGSSSVGVRSNARYVGSLVADVHNILINGGIYGYPATLSNKNGKLRLLYESAPMSLIMEQAGGAGSTGRGRILDVKPTNVHERYVAEVRHLVMVATAVCLVFPANPISWRS